MATLEERLAAARQATGGADGDLEERLARARASLATDQSPGSAVGALGQAAGKVGGALAQVPYGFNQRLGQIVGAASEIDPLRPIYEATGIPQPARKLAEWLVGQQMSPPATNVPERVMRAGGEMLAETVGPAAGLQAVASSVARPAVTLAERAVDQLLGAYRTAPAAVAGGEAISGTGAGMGGQIAEEVAPGSTWARIAGEILGGLGAPMTVLPTVRAGARAAGAISRHLGSEAQTQRAREYVGRELGEHLSSEEARQGLRRADEIAEEVPGFSPSLAQRTRIPALAATQESIEKQARGSELDVMVGRHQRNAKALEDYARRYAPRGDAGADAAVEPLVRARQQAAERVRAFEREKAALAKQYSPEAMAARREAIRDREREALQVLRERTTGQRQDITAGIERIDRGAVGERLRGKVQERRAEAMARMGELSAQLGLNDADVTVPYQTFYRGLQRWTDSMLPSQRDNLPGTFQDVLELGRRAAARMEAIQGQALLKGDVMGALDATPPVTFREIKALREAVTDEWLEAVRDTSPGHRKRLANVLQLRRMIDNELLGENLDTAQPGLADAYKQFRGRYLQEVIQPFERGAVKEVRRSDGTGFFRTLDEDVAAKALESQDAARQFRQVLGDDADAMADLQAVALDDLANAAVRGGVVQPRQLENWLVKRRLALEEFPEIRDTVARIARAVTDVEEAERGTKAAIMDRGLQARRGITADQNRLRQAEERLDQEMRPLLERMGALNERQMALEDTMLARRLAGIERGNQTPATLIDEAVGKPALMAKLWTQLDGQPEAQEALRRHVWDGLTKLDGAALNQFLTDNNNSLKIAFSEPHLRRLKMIADGLEMLAAVPPPTRGRPISPDPVERLKELTGADPSSMAARYLAVRRGRSSRWVEGFTGLMNLLRQRGKMASDELMKRALYDPEVAQSIADSVNLPKSKAAQSRLRGWMFAVGATGPAEEQRQ